MNERGIAEKNDRERLATIEAIVSRMEQRLLGNGQPGEIDKLKQRVSRLESWFWRAAGCVTLAVLLLETLHR